MMQGHARAADFLYQRLATRLQFFQIRRAPRRIRCPVKHDIGRFQLAERPVVRIGKHVHLFRDPERCLPHPIVRADVTHDSRINPVADNH